MKDEPTYKFGILGDSIVVGTYVKKTMIVSYPGATLGRLLNDAVLEEFVQAIVTGVAIEAGTNNLVDMKKQIGIVDEIAAKLETLVKTFQEAGIAVTIVKIPRRVGYKEEVKQLNRKYEKAAKRTGAHFNTPKRFTVGGSGEKDDLTGGLHTDGLHPNPENLQRYSEDLYDTLKPLF